MNPCKDCVCKNTEQCSCEKLSKYELYVSTYNQALEDFEKALLSNDVVDKSVVRRTAEQLKKSENMSDFKVLLPTTTKEWQRDMNIAYSQALEDLLFKVKEHHYLLSDKINSTDYGMFTYGIEQAANELKR